MKRLVLILLMLVLGYGYATAGSVEVALENDVIAGTDKYYTHGTRITHSHPFKSNLFPDKEATRRWVIGQHMYTPTDISVEELQVGDRPYAGWLYGATSVSVADEDSMDFLEMTIGVTGSWSGGEDVQKWFHKTVDSEKPMGWDNQVDERIGVNVTYMKKYRWKSKYSDAILKGDVTAGNIYCHAGVGFVYRVGYNVPDDFGLVRMEPSSRGLNDFGIYGIFEASERFVGYNYFLEGNDIEETYDIHADWAVYDFGVGCGVYYKDVSLIYMYSVRSPEFKEQTDYVRFGTIALSWGY
jgi:hypothetical protein